MTGLVPLCDGLAGADTGGVLEWSPAGGWSLPGTQINTGNDVAVSRDGEWVYIGGWNSRCIKKVRRGSAGEPKTLAVEELIEYGPDTFGAATTALQVGREIWVGTARDQGLARSRFPMTNRS